MANRMSATRLRAELFKTLDQVVSSGESVEIERPGGTVRMVLAASGSRLARLSPHPGTVSGNPEDLATLSWEDAWQPVP
jgi:hypothetical protein